MEIAKEAVETNFWPLFEVENGRYRINHRPKERLPIRGWLEKQGRFKHLFKPGNEALIDTIQRWIDDEWEKLERLEAKDARDATEANDAERIGDRT
jgi:pyruvate ferredoxin oxidoreductase beta subunit